MRKLLTELNWTELQTIGRFMTLCNASLNCALIPAILLLTRTITDHLILYTSLTCAFSHLLAAMDASRRLPKTLLSPLWKLCCCFRSKESNSRSANQPWTSSPKTYPGGGSLLHSHLTLGPAVPGRQIHFRQLNQPGSLIWRRHWVLCRV